MTTPLEILFHIIELGSAVLLLYATFFAIKSFKLAPWKKPWYIISIGAFILILKNIFEHIFIHMRGIKEIDVMFICLHALMIVSMLTIAIGIFVLSKSVVKVMGK